MNKPQRHAALIKAWADGAEIEYWSLGKEKWLDVPHPVPWSSDIDYRIKPPAPKWPETTMTDQEIQDVVSSSQGLIQSRRAIANAALAHALETGQVVLKRDFDKAKRALLRAGFVDHGGEEWRPPLGEPPAYVKGFENGFFGRVDGGGN